LTGLPMLNVISAGAGSGKTHRITETVARWVRDGLVAPDRIIAVTFTEAGAAELKGRLRKELIDLGRTEDALKLDQAYISTIHSFGLRVLTEFAFDGGFPPRSRLLDQNEESALLRQAVARAGNIGSLTRELTRYGYKYDGGTQTSGEDQFRQMVQKVIGHLRTLNQSRDDQTYSGFSERFLKTNYGPTGGAATALSSLSRAVEALLDRFPADISANFSGNASAVKEFRKNHTDLTVARNQDRLATDWHLWDSLRKLRTSKRSAATPEGYDTLADAVIMAAEELPHHPGPLVDAINHAKILIGSAVEAIEGYSIDKRKAALVDYTDMVAAAQMILASETGTLKALADRVDCLVIDEFQDTNPLQFSLLWLLQRAGIPTLIVGDLKQAIMGFQGADPRLMKRLLADEKANTSTLDKNWRTQPLLMPFINSLGHALFGDNYTELAAQTDGGFQAPLEVLEQPKPASGGSKKPIRTLRIAERIKSLLDDPDQSVRDRHTKQKRRLTTSDIAILCPTNGHLQDYADALRKFGVKAKITEDGWISSRVVQLAWYALEYAENSNDRHAATYLATTEFGQHDLQSAITELINDEQICDPILEKLSVALDGGQYATVDVVLSKVLRALGLYGRISNWPDTQKHRADLLRLEAEAKAFVDAKPETLASGGFFGSGVKTFLAWLSAKVEQEKEGNHRPDPDVTDTDTVEMVTWHRSKGREWPVVFVCGWDTDVKSRLPNVGVEYEKFDDLDDVLNDARISFIPQFAAKEANERFLSQMQENTILSAKRLVYVALTRARERLVLEWHSHLTDSKRTTYHSMLIDEVGVSLGESGIAVSGSDYSCLLSGNDGTPPETPETHLSTEPLPTIGRRALVATESLVLQPEMFTTPSSLARKVDITEAQTQRVDYGQLLVLDMEVSGAAFGTMIHRCFEVLTASPESGSLLADATGQLITNGQANAISASHKAMTGWFRDNVGARQITSEVPFSALAEDSTICTGIIDMLVEAPDGYWVIDHKTDRAIEEDDILSHYLPQLQGYRDALENLGHTVVGVGLNLVNDGKLLLVRTANGS
jgi:ATP-dependent helicase/nuclease subunit A